MAAASKADDRLVVAVTAGSLNSAVGPGPPSHPAKGLDCSNTHKLQKDKGVLGTRCWWIGNIFMSFNMQKLIMTGKWAASKI